jgi:hypothetical protein
VVGTLRIITHATEGLHAMGLQLAGGTRRSNRVIHASPHSESSEFYM